MVYVVVNEATGLKVSFPRTGKTMYATLRTARAAVTRLVKIDMDKYFTREVKTPTKYAIMEATAYLDQLPMVKVRNLMSGVEVEIRADQVGSCVDPSTELYWTM